MTLIKENVLRSFLGTTVFIIHFLLVFFILVVPFLDIPLFILIIHALFIIVLVQHWYHNSNICSLSIIESKLSGKPYTQTFMHRIISPIYDIGETQLSTLCYIISALLFFYVIYRLYTEIDLSIFKEHVKTKGLFNDSTLNALMKNIM
jgi:hypothetical protein